MLFEQAFGVVATALIAKARCSCSSTLRADQGERHAGLREITLGFEIVGGDRDAGRVHAAAGEAAGLDEGQEIRAVGAAHAQHDRRLRAFGLPVPVLAVDQFARGTALRQDDRAGAAVVEFLLGLDRLVLDEACLGDDLGAGIDHDDVFERDAGAVGDAAHFLDVMRAEGLDLLGEFGDQRRLGLGIVAELAELAAIEFDRALHAAGHGSAVLAATLIGGAGHIDEGAGLDHGAYLSGMLTGDRAVVYFIIN